MGGGGRGRGGGIYINSYIKRSNSLKIKDLNSRRGRVVGIATPPPLTRLLVFYFLFIVVTRTNFVDSVDKGTLLFSWLSQVFLN